MADPAARNAENRIAALQAGQDQLAEELKTQRGQLIGLTVMLCLLGLMIYMVPKQTGRILSP